jgi:LasA protease
MVDYVATNFSISPRDLLALLEYQTGALSDPTMPATSYALGQVDYNYAGIYLQLVWAAGMLNNGYYGWRTGRLTSFDHIEGTIERPDPWQNAASVAFQYYFSRHLTKTDYDRAVGPDGLVATYHQFFGDPWQTDLALIPVSLHQPDLSFPFPDGQTWAFTGGPHTGWGSPTLDPLAAVDFAPPAVVGGCTLTDLPAVAVADGVVVRSQTGVVMLDLDGDSDERTGWDILYLHIATVGRVALGTKLHRGDPVGFPSCEGGEATGTHVHVVRKYNGEWIPADGPLAFNFEGWVVHNGDEAYQGTLTRGTQAVPACVCSTAASQVTAGK